MYGLGGEDWERILRGYDTHSIATAYHEVGHALAALKVGRYVEKIAIWDDDPKSGYARIFGARRNPYSIDSSDGNAEAAWRYTRKQTYDDIFILLAGPLAEARLLGTNLKLLGNKSDLDRCMGHIVRLQWLAQFAGQYTPVAAFDAGDELNVVRTKTRRWVGQKHIWQTIEFVAKYLAKHGRVGGEQFHYLIGFARENHWSRSMRPAAPFSSQC